MTRIVALVEQVLAMVLGRSMGEAAPLARSPFAGLFAGVAARTGGVCDGGLRWRLAGGWGACG